MNKIKELAHWASSRSQITYYWIGILTLILPNLFLSYSMDVSLVGRILNISLPLGVWMLILALGRKPGKTLLFPFGIMLLIGAVQLVLLTIFEGAVISVDLLLSLFSASGDEAGELLGARPCDAHCGCLFGYLFVAQSFAFVFSFSSLC